MSAARILCRVWENLVYTVQESLMRLHKEDALAVLDFWAPRGGGKTTFLSLLCTAWADLLSEVVLLGPWDARAMPPSQMAHDILVAIDKAPIEKRKLVLVDNLDNLLKIGGGKPFIQFEEEVARTVIERGDTVLIVTSLFPIVQWKEYDVRVQQRSIHIPPLNKEDVREWAENHDMGPERALHLSMGYPQVLAWLQETPDLSEEAIDRRIESYFREGLSEKAGEAAEITSAFLSFDLDILQKVDVALGSSISPEKEEDIYGEYADLIRELIAAGLVFWEVNVGAYRFRDSVVRQLIARSFRHRRPDDFQKLQNVAADYYTSEARHASYLDRTLISAIYHLAYTHGSEGPERALHWVKSTLDLWNSAPWDRVLRVWISGMGDDYVLMEMKELLGLSVWEQITHLLESAALAAEQIREEVKS